MSIRTDLVWRGTPIKGDGSDRFKVDTLEGFAELSGASYGTTERAAGHGVDITTPVYRAAKILATGWVFSEPGRDSPDEDANVAALRALFRPQAARGDRGELEPLIVTQLGRTVTADVHLIAFRPTVTMATVASGAIPWAAQWVQPDPRVFGDPITRTAPLVIPAEGVRIPQLLPFSLPARPLDGQVVIDNPGGDDEGSPAVITLTGPQIGAVGVSNDVTGARIVYGFPLAVGDELVIDTNTGESTLNGEYRSPLPSVFVIDDLYARPGANVYRATGTPGQGGTATISVTVRPRDWY